MRVGARWRSPPVIRLADHLVACIDGAFVPLAPRGLPPASLGSLGSSRSSAKAGDWGRMKFILTD